MNMLHQTSRGAMWLATTALMVMSLGCSGVTDRVGEARETVASVTERARFCVAAAQAVAAIDGEPSADDLAVIVDLADKAPSHLADKLAGLEVELQAAADGDFAPLNNPEVIETLRELQQSTMETCDPRN